MGGGYGGINLGNVGGILGTHDLSGIGCWGCWVGLLGGFEVGGFGKFGPIRFL